MRQYLERSCLLLCCGLWSLSANAQVAPPLSPQEAERTFALHPDCRIELVACEPDVIDPVAIAFAPDGRLWVVEYSDYPHGPGEGEPGLSRIRVLTGPDQHGRYSQPVTFAEGLVFANGLLHWREGVLVTTNGQVLFLRDTDGDGRCDEQQQWFTGFATENPQLRCNHPTLGPDNRIYIANGLRGGKIVPGKDYPWPLPEKVEPLDISGRDFRFDPLTGHYEAISGNGQFGLSFDDFGNRFVCSNRNPCNHLILEEEDLRNAPYLRVPKVFEEVSPAAEASRLFPISRTWTTSNLHANQFTAACGVLIYRSTGLPADCYGNSFVCEPTGNLVHRDRLTPAGVTFTSKPDREGIEFLASADEWFRPVNLEQGPDGALYVVDMYRAVIEHPQFVPDELKNRPDQLLGMDRGRIWRIVARNSDRQRDLPPNPFPTAGTAELIELLGHPDNWYRSTAQGLLLERGDRSLAPALAARWLTATASGSPAHWTALRLLDTWGALQPEHIFGSVPAPEADPLLMSGFRNHLLPLARHRFSEHPQRIAFEAAQRRWLLRQLSVDAVTPPSQPWVSIRLQLDAGSEPYPLWQELLHIDNSPPLAVIRDVARAVGRKQTDAETQALIRHSLATATTPPGLAAAALAGLAEGLPGRRGAFRAHLKATGPNLPEEFEQFVQLLLRSNGSPADSLSPLAITLAGYADSEESLRSLLERLSSQPQFEPQLIEALSLRPEPAASAGLAQAFPLLTVAGRNRTVAALLGTVPQTQLLLDLVESRQLPPASIDPNIVKRLLNHADPEVKSRAASLLQLAPPADRLQVLAEYQPCLSLPANPLHGKQVFIKHCATCHKIGDVGVDVAPDISDSRTKTADYLLTHILDPNRAIDNNFYSYTVVDTQGLVYTGVMASETALFVTLKQPEGKLVSLARSDVEEIRNNGVSLMPVGLEKNIPLQEMADLISFIKNWRYLDGSVPPEIIR
jgi:putative membrane-bound dehydrogenase-like protein